MSEPANAHEADLRLGRNTPCACGSGKRFRHCCLIASIQEGESAVEQSMKTCANAIAQRPCYHCRKEPRSIPVPGYLWQDEKSEGRPTLMPLCPDCIRSALAQILALRGPTTAQTYPVFVPSELEMRDDYDLSK